MFFSRCISLSVFGGAWPLGRRNGLDIGMPGLAHCKPMVGDILELWGGKREQSIVVFTYIALGL